MVVEMGEAEAGEHLTALPDVAAGIYLSTIRTPHGDAGILIRVE
jgi:hypothetical protein